MTCLCVIREYRCSAHLVNCAFDQMRCVINYFVQHLAICAMFDQSHSALNAIGLGLALRLGLGLGEG